MYAVRAVSKHNICIIYIVLGDKRIDDDNNIMIIIITNMNTITNVCDWTRGQEKFAFPRLSTGDEKKNSYTRLYAYLYTNVHGKKNSNNK